MKFFQIVVILLLLYSNQMMSQQVGKLKPIKSVTINLMSESLKVDTSRRMQKNNLNKAPLPLDQKLPKNAKIIKQANPFKDTSQFLEINLKDDKDTKNQPMFPGLGDDNTSIPPDLGAAVGPNHLMIALNSPV